MPSDATILHADLDAFYASVEQRDDPSLRGRPVIVGGGVVLAASYEAKARGVRTAMGGGPARRLCPDAVVVSPRMSAYSEASKAVFEVFRDTSPLVEGLSIDEAFLDVRGMERFAGTPEEIAVRLRTRVREEVGLPITVGVARTKFLAKVASGVAKPDGLLVVEPDPRARVPARPSGGAAMGSRPGELGTSCASGGSRASARWRGSASRHSCRWWARRRGASCTRWLTTVTRVGCGRDRGGARWGRSTRSGGEAGPARRWMRC